MAKPELPKTYDFSTTETRLYEWWEKSGFFTPQSDPAQDGFDAKKESFVISIPPANVTGSLHLGHAMFVSMEDLMIRYHRMKGYSALWVPGTDHAGIATQLQVEKMLISQGTSREELGRDKFEETTWEWKRKYGGLITKQIRRLGASCDWSREHFTLDDQLSKAVREAFVRLYEKGLIYRGPRLINWSPGLKTAVSDLEVEYSQEPGKLYYFKYMLADGSGEYLPVATTRPETILGDTAVAVHPEDDRFKKYVGKMVSVPMMGREVPVIADEYVDREFGTGALKITPGHDPHDYEIGQKHNLALISILDKKACINENGGQYEGMDRFDCRKKLWADMEEAGLVIKEEPYQLNVPRSQRGGEIIEPMVSTQWFVKIKPLAEPALAAVKEGRINIVPEHFTKVYYNWMENIQDWCISRQLWWGHRIPVWYCADCGEMIVSREDPNTCPKCGGQKLNQDPDVLDTWFSSGLWPFSTLGWPDVTPDMDYFYPTSMMETGYDILFFWVARMIMFGIEFTGKEPFNTVYLHGLIRDEHGQKMSKTKGNVIDPLEVMDEMGTDALRFTILVGSTPGKDMNLSTKKVEATRNFANKIWNAGRYVIGAMEKAPAKPVGDPQWSLADSYIWARCQQLIRDVERLFGTYQYGEAGRQIYDFFWAEFADWYVEISKLQLNQGGDTAFYTARTLVHVLDNCLRLLHPFIPFITEELWGHLRDASKEHSELLEPELGWGESLMLAKWPEPTEVEDWETEAIQSYQSNYEEQVKTVRNARAEKNITPGKYLENVEISYFNAFELSQIEKESLAKLCHLDSGSLVITNGTSFDQTGGTILTTSASQIFIPLQTIDQEAETLRVKAELKETEGQIKRLEGLLSSPFAQKAPPAVVDKERQRLETFKETAEKLKQQLG